MATAKKRSNNSAQALVEFVLLLPIIIMILLVVIDFASIFYNRNHLEGVLNDVVAAYSSDITKSELTKIIDNPHITYTISKDGDLTIIKLEQSINLITPFSNVFFKDPYIITTKRTIL